MNRFTVHGNREAGMTPTIEIVGWDDATSWRTSAVRPEGMCGSSPGFQPGGIPGNPGGCHPVNREP
jgi:hypothetical protein